MSRIVPSYRTFEPKTVVIEASWAAISEFNLNEHEGEHYDRIHDVISVEHDDSDVVFTTVRTIERPDRKVWRIPRRYVENITG